jgi:hypothetical protein
LVDPRQKIETKSIEFTVTPAPDVENDPKSLDNIDYDNALKNQEIKVNEPWSVENTEEFESVELDRFKTPKKKNRSKSKSRSKSKGSLSKASQFEQSELK